MANVEIPALLSGLGGTEPPAPAWFRDALDKAPERLWVEAKGARLETLVWGERGKPGLLLMHGNGANADWWSFIAPFFAADYRVVAFSWAGMGRSDWRDAYSSETFVDEIFAVAEATGLYDAPVKPVFVGHSFGGFILATAAAWQGERIGAAVIVDSPARTDEMDREHREKRRMPRTDGRPHRIYPTIEAALARFRFAPPQSCANIFIADMIARHSLKQVPGDGEGTSGWTWRFDPALWRNLRLENHGPLLREARCPVALLWGDRSLLMPRKVVDFMRTLVGPDAPMIEIPDAEHHVMIDQPLAFVAALRGLLASWPKGG